MKCFLTVLAAAAIALASLAAVATGDPSEYEVESAAASLSKTQAGAFPDLTIDFALKREAGGQLPATTRDIKIDLPPGFLANPNSVPKCTAAQLTGTDPEDKSNQTGCSQDTQVGVTEVLLSKNKQSFIVFEPIYNMESPGGDTVARLGFIADLFPVFVDAHLRSASDFGASVTIEGAGTLIPLLSAKTTIWGVPADPSHDTQRITPYEATHGGVPETSSGKRESGLSSPQPFMSNPTRCGVSNEIKVTATSHAFPDQPSSRSASLPVITGCGQLNFNPKFSVTPTSAAAAEPTGLDTDLDIPQNESAIGYATSQLRLAKVVLPRGVIIASGAGAGLQACSAQQVGAGTEQAASCPDAAKIGTAEVDSPSLPRILHGAIYQRTPVKGDLFGIWLTTDELGVHLKLPGEVHADSTTGQLTTTFEGLPASEGLPQAPVRDFRLNFFGGPRAPLANPRSCGSYSTAFEFVPWSGGKASVGQAPMTVDQGCNTGGFNPGFSAGSLNPVAGRFAPFVTELTLNSGEENLRDLQVTLPPGVSAKLAGVPLCSGVDATLGTCSPASRVGTVAVASGPGSFPLWIPQPGKEQTAVYLGGPYEGAPYSLVIKVPAQAGPFDLGTVVSRATISIDPVTARATVAADSLPQILEGVPISYRTIHVDIDRADFALNPTGCNPSASAATATSSGGAVSTPSSRFQVGSCDRLGFKPRLSIRLRGGTGRGAHPSLEGVLRPRAGNSNIERTVVTLPHAEFLDQGHIRTVCTRVQFNAGSCPAASVYGHAKAFSPLLDQPLKGPVYLRSSNHELPDLVVALHGAVDIDASARIDSIDGGIRTTFEAVPDEPLSKFVLFMQGGKKGLLINSRNFCLSSVAAGVEFTAHSGHQRDLNVPLGVTCGTHGKSRH